MNLVPLGRHPIKGRGLYAIQGAFAELNGRLECLALLVEAPPGRRIDGDVLRRLPVSELVRNYALLLEAGLQQPVEQVMRPDASGVPTLQEPDEEFKRKASEFRRLAREAARAGGETRLKMAAEIYKRAARRGTAGRPTQAVAEELHISYDAAVSLVRRCRQADPPLLPPTTRGRPNAVTTSPKPRKGR